MMKKALRISGMAAAAIVIVLVMVLVYWGFRPNRSNLNTCLNIQVWDAVNDGMHNSNTDLAHWKGNFYLVHASSPYHMGTRRSRLVLHRSADAVAWKKIGEFSVPGEDVRDPKLWIMGDRLVLLVLKNLGFEPEPYGTAMAVTTDGENWSPFKDLSPRGWLLWRPKTRDGKTWYVTAYWHEHGRSVLMKSVDGENWETVSEIHRGDRNDETAMEFLPDGRLLITARLEGKRSWHQGSSDAATLIAVASPPYRKWVKTRSTLTRLDGPVLFSTVGKIYAAGRYDPMGYDPLYGMSSLLGKKRTALYRVEPHRLVRISDLPSCGDTSYPGVVIRGGDLYISYYTSEVRRDYPWLLGLIMPSQIKIARVPLGKLVTCPELPAQAR